MKLHVTIATLVACMAICSQSFGYDLLDRMLGGSGCASGCAQAAPACGCDSVAAPTCGVAQRSCAVKRCRQKLMSFNVRQISIPVIVPKLHLPKVRLPRLCKPCASGCATAAAPTCAAPAPTCAAPAPKAPACGCDATPAPTCAAPAPTCAAPAPTCASSTNLCGSSTNLCCCSYMRNQVLRNQVPTTRSSRSHQEQVGFTTSILRMCFFMCICSCSCSSMWLRRSCSCSSLWLRRCCSSCSSCEGC